MNVIGPYEGRSVQNDRDSNPAVLEVRAEGSWSIRFEPVAAATEYAAGVFAGRGNDVVRLASPTEGLTTATLTFSGSRNFIVKGLDINGAYMDLMANQIGDFSGQVLVEPGIQLLEVRGNGGTWTIQID